LKRNSIARAIYRLRKDVGEAGTLIRFTDRLAAKGSMPVRLALTVDGRTKLWSTAIDGLIQRKASEAAFERGDIDSNGRVNLADAVIEVQHSLGASPEIPDCDDALDSNDDGKLDLADAITILEYLFRDGPEIAPPFIGDCATDPTPDLLSCRESGCSHP
jgi:hypothetical protein